MSHKEDMTMKDAIPADNTAEPKYFLMWVGLWIAALMVLLPLLARP
jgi:hypothetical protein